jgi:hypothetical protein
MPELDYPREDAMGQFRRRLFPRERHATERSDELVSDPFEALRRVARDPFEALEERSCARRRSEGCPNDTEYRSMFSLSFPVVKSCYVRCFLPEVREFIKDTRPKTNTTRGGRKAHRPTPKTRTIHPTVLPDR